MITDIIDNIREALKLAKLDTGDEIIYKNKHSIITCDWLGIKEIELTDFGLKELKNILFYRPELNEVNNNKIKTIYGIKVVDNDANKKR